MVFNKQILNNLFILSSDFLQRVLDIRETLSVIRQDHSYSLHTVRDCLVQLVLDSLLLVLGLAVHDSLVVFRDDVGKVDRLSILSVNSLHRPYHAVHRVTMRGESPHQMEILVFWHQLLHVQVVVWKDDQFSIVDSVSVGACRILARIAHDGVIHHLPHSPLHGSQVASRRSGSPTRSEASSLRVSATLQLVLIGPALGEHVDPVSVLSALDKVRQSNLIDSSIPVNGHDFHETGAHRLEKGAEHDLLGAQVPVPAVPRLEQTLYGEPHERVSLKGRTLGTILALSRTET